MKDSALIFALDGVCASMKNAKDIVASTSFSSQAFSCLPDYCKERTAEKSYMKGASRCSGYR